MMQIRSTVRRNRRGSFTAANLLACLLLLFALPFVADAEPPDSNVPICCQSHGKHQCSLRMHRAEQQGQGTTANAPTLHEKCPFTPVAPASTHATLAFANLANSPIRLCPTRTSCTRQFRSIRSTSDCSNPKRGPPSSRSIL